MAHNIRLCVNETCLVAVILCLAVSMALPLDSKKDQILQENSPWNGNKYSSRYVTLDASRTEKSILKSNEGCPKSLNVEGQYTYRFNDDIIRRIVYETNEKGFQLKCIEEYNLKTGLKKILLNKNEQSPQVSFRLRDNDINDQIVFPTESYTSNQENVEQMSDQDILDRFGLPPEVIASLLG